MAIDKVKNSCHGGHIMNYCPKSEFVDPDLGKAWLTKYTPKTVTGIVYIIQMGDKPVFKIGITNDIKSRISNLQVGNPYKLTAAAAFAVLETYSEEVERYAHTVVSGLGERLSGEWFSISLADAVSSVELAASSSSTKLISMDRLGNYTQKEQDAAFEAHKKGLMGKDKERRAQLRVKLGIE